MTLDWKSAERGSTPRHYLYLGASCASRAKRLCTGGQARFTRSRCKALTMPTISLEAKRAADHSALGVVTALCVPLLAVALLMKIGLVLPLVALLALGAVWFAIRHVEWVAPTLLFLLYSNFTVAATHMYGVPENAASGVFALMAIPFAVQCYRQGLIFDRTFGFMISLFVVMIISAGASESPEDSFEALIRYGGEGLAVYLLVVNTVRDRLALRRCLAALLLAGAITGSLSAIESAGGPQIFSGSTADSSVATESGTSSGDRSTGSVGEANRFGQMLVVVLPFTLLFYRAAGSRASPCRTTGRRSPPGRSEWPRSSGRPVIRSPAR